MSGPRLSDEAFFEALDLSRADMRVVKRAVKTRDWTGVLRAFAEHIRRASLPSMKSSVESSWRLFIW